MMTRFFCLFFFLLLLVNCIYRQGLDDYMTEKYNQPPAISSISAVYTNILVNQINTVTVRASDPDQNKLTYSYKITSGSGSLSGSETRCEEYQSDSATVVKIKAVVKDIWGGSDSAVISFNVFAPDQSGNLIGHYTCDGNTLDSSGLNNHGTEQGGLSLTYGYTGLNNTAYLFDGIDDLIDLGDLPDFDGGFLTLSAWIKTTGLSVTIISKDDVNAAPAERSFRLLVDGSGLLEFIVYNSANPTLDFQSITSNSLVNNGEWHHVVATWNGNVMRVYVDGDLEKSANYAGTIFASTASIQIGANQNGAAREWFSGTIDNIRLFKAALSANEIKALFNEQ